MSGQTEHVAITYLRSYQWSDSWLNRHDIAHVRVQGTRSHHVRAGVGTMKGFRRWQIFIFIFVSLPCSGATVGSPRAHLRCFSSWVATTASSKCTLRGTRVENFVHAPRRGKRARNDAANKLLLIVFEPRTNIHLQIYSGPMG